MTKAPFDLKSVPKKPGVYVYRDLAKKIIYIGKALNLKSRVGSYFRQVHRDTKTTILVTQIASAEFIIVGSEFEALILEARLIKQHRPKYNISQKDDKSPLYIGITKEYPNRLLTIRRPELKTIELLDWYGPFPSGVEARQILETVRRIFPFCTSKTDRKRLCLYFHLKLCPGVCGMDVPTYPKTIKRIRKLLSGQSSKLIALLKKEMTTAAKDLRFEEANIIKKQLEAFGYLTKGWKGVPKENMVVADTLLRLRKTFQKYGQYDPVSVTRIEGYDISNLGPSLIVGAMVVFTNGLPDKSQYRKFKINDTGLKYRKNLEDQNDPEAIAQIIARRLNHPDWLLPQIMIIDGAKTQVTAAWEAIRQKGLLGKLAVVGLAKKEEELYFPVVSEKQLIAGWKIVKLARRTPDLQLVQQVRDEAHRFAQSYYKVLHAKKVFN